MKRSMPSLKTIFFALLFVALVATTSFASSVSVTSTSLQTKYGSLSYVYFENTSGPGSSSPNSNTASTLTSNSGSYTLAASSSAYLWSPQFGSATTINSGNWVLGLWAASTSNILAYVPITATNGQTSTTPNPFQIEITWNPSSYSSDEATNLGNIRFYSNSAFTTPLNAWLESCTPSLSNTATSAAAWVKLTSPIAGNGGTATIYMTFLSTATTYDGNYWGQAPNLSSTYGQYDNGANVFTFYDNFAGTSLSTKWTTVESSGTVAVNNGITFTTSSSSGYAFVASKTTQTYPNIAEAYLTSSNSGVNPMLGVSTTASANSWIALYNGYSVDEALSSTDLLEIVGQSSSGGTQVSSVSVSSFSYGIWQLNWSATGSEMATNGNYTLTSTSSTVTIGNYGIYIGQSNFGTGSNVFSWARMRAVPPSGVMPSASLGALSLPVYAWLPITLTNSQTSTTPNPFQIEITWNPSSYSSDEATNLGNIRFYSNSAFTTPLNAWLESCTPSLSNTATSATAWIKLTSPIAGNNGTLTIYMAFLATATSFDGNYWGEAPSLSGTYGAYDNGANVFNAYFNGNTATSSFSVYSGDTLTQATGVSGPGGTTINAIKVTGSTGAHVPAFSYNEAMSNTALIAESSFSLAGDTGDATGAVGLADNATVNSIQNGITAQMGYGSNYFSQAYEIAGAVTLDANGAGASTTNWLYASVTYTGSAASSWNAYIAPQLYSSTGGYSGTVSNSPLSSSGYIYLSQISGSSAINVYYNFFRARAYPPNNVMPSVSFGSLTVSANTIQVSICVTNSSGNIQSTVASNTQSSSIGTSEGEYTMSFTGSQVSIPQNGYLMVLLSSSSTASYTIYWGKGQPTNFQALYRILSQ